LSDPLTRRIYLLDPKRFSPETIAVAFAKTSRSPLSFDTIAEDLNAEKSAEFNEKWVVGYGHASVAEHAVLHLAIENVSRLAVESIEGNRLASFTEKSTRYQNWEQQAFYTPLELNDHPLKQVYQDTCAKLFDLYIDCRSRLQTQISRDHPHLAGESDNAFERRMHAMALDAARYLLPASSLANLGMTANARTLEHAISKLLSSSLDEVRQIGESIKAAACASVPTLIKYAAANDYLRLLAARIDQTSSQSTLNPAGDWLRLVNFNSLGIEKILASLQYRYSDRDYESCFDQVSHLPPQDKQALIDRVLTILGPHDCLPHEFEHTSYTFDVIMDQGAYYEVKRHRMMTQSAQALGASLGYTTPRVFEESGLLERYQGAMDGAAACWEKLAGWNPAVAAYIVPNGFKRRVLLSMNLREAYTFIKLRSSPNAHFAVRRVACRMAEEIQKAHPILERLFPQNSAESSDGLNRVYFS
jgi:thymidylate synthase ThyX